MIDDCRFWICDCGFSNFYFPVSPAGADFSVQVCEALVILVPRPQTQRVCAILRGGNPLRPQASRSGKTINRTHPKERDVTATHGGTICKWEPSQRRQTSEGLRQPAGSLRADLSKAVCPCNEAGAWPLSHVRR
jgi:hypothetical protein